MAALDTCIILGLTQSCTPAGGQLNFTIKSTASGTRIDNERPEQFVAFELLDPDGLSIKAGQYGTTQQQVVVTGIPNGFYRLRVYNEYDQESAQSVQVSCAAPPPPPEPVTEPTIDPVPAPVVPTCQDPEADNYGSTANGGVCVYSPRVVLDELPELVANGAPVLVTLHSARVGGTPGRAQLLVTFAGTPPAGTQLVINGAGFTMGAITRSDRFQDAPTLLAALQAVPTLAGAYQLTQPTAETVLLVALEEGIAGTVTASTTAPEKLVLDAQDGAPRYQSQRRVEWGLYCEVWAQCGIDYGGATSKATAVLAARFESRYRTDNRYVFDIADALRQYTQHRLTQAPGHIADRMVSYFLRFGEVYADAVAGFRTRRNAYESGVVWALEAVELPPESTPGVRVLSAAPIERPGLPFQVAYLLLSASAADALGYQTSETTYAGVMTQSSRDALPGIAPMGGVYCLPQLYSPAAVRAQLGFTLSTTPAQVLRTAQLDITPGVRSLIFANRQGGFDTVLFPGVQDELLKRSPATYGTQAGEQLRVVELEQPVRLYTKLLDLEYWRWLRTELAATSSAWVNGRPVTITDFDVTADVLKGEYTASVEYKTAPIRGISN